jgi:small-conductance mechanosensitive channel
MLQIAYIALTLLLYVLVYRALSRVIKRLGEANEVRSSRTAYVNKTIQIALVLIAIGIISLILGIDYGELSIFISSAFAVIGVALFAQWSILSNITASIIIFFGFPYRLGDHIRVVEPGMGEETFEGEIKEISLFHVLIKKSNGDQITYPNSLLLQRPVIKIKSKMKREDGEEEQPDVLG